MLISFVVVYFVDLLTIRAHFDRYVLPLVPPLGALAGRARYLAPVTLLLLVVPLAWSIRDDRVLTREDTRIVAHRWIERNVPRGARVAADSSTPPLAGFRVLPLQLPGPGRPHDPNRDVGRLRARGVRYALVTGAVEDRVVAAQRDGDVDSGLVIAGQCAAAIHDIVGVRDLLEGMVREASELLAAAGRLAAG